MDYNRPSFEIPSEQSDGQESPQSVDVELEQVLRLSEAQAQDDQQRTQSREEEFQREFQRVIELSQEIHNRDERVRSWRQDTETSIERDTMEQISREERNANERLEVRRTTAAVKEEETLRRTLTESESDAIKERERRTSEMDRMLANFGRSPQQHNQNSPVVPAPVLSPIRRAHTTPASTRSVLTSTERSSEPSSFASPPSENSLASAVRLSARIRRTDRQNTPRIPPTTTPSPPRRQQSQRVARLAIAGQRIAERLHLSSSTSPRSRQESTPTDTPLISSNRHSASPRRPSRNSPSHNTSSQPQARQPSSLRPQTQSPHLPLSRQPRPQHPALYPPGQAIDPAILNDSLRSQAQHALRHASEFSAAYRRALATLDDPSQSRALNPEDGLHPAFAPPTYKDARNDRICDHWRYTTTNESANEPGRCRRITRRDLERMALAEGGVDAGEAGDGNAGELGRGALLPLDGDEGLRSRGHQVMVMPALERRLEDRRMREDVVAMEGWRRRERERMEGRFSRIPGRRSGFGRG